jgi:hypothetical protein
MRLFREHFILCESKRKIQKLNFMTGDLNPLNVAVKWVICRYFAALIFKAQ